MLIAPVAMPPGSATELPIAEPPPATAAVIGTMNRSNAGNAKIASSIIIMPVIARTTASLVLPAWICAIFMAAA